MNDKKIKVISFSIWGTERSFVDGAIENARLAKEMYPDWTVWFFCQDNFNNEWLLELDKTGAEVFTMKETKGAWEGLFWRFYPIFDRRVSHTISRDCDSRLNPREKAAVDAWLESKRLFHTMRDHIEHNVPVLGGMFGCKHWPEFQSLLHEWKEFSAKGCDQDFLRVSVWPKVDGKNLAHDRYPYGHVIDIENGSYEYNPIKFFGDHDVRPFPTHSTYDTTQLGEHVGARVGLSS